MQAKIRQGWGRKERRDMECPKVSVISQAGMHTCMRPVAMMSQDRLSQYRNIIGFDSFESDVVGGKMASGAGIGCTPQPSLKPNFDSSLAASARLTDSLLPGSSRHLLSEDWHSPASATSPSVGHAARCSHYGLLHRQRLHR